MQQIDPIYRLPKLKEILGVSKTSIYDWMAKNQFPHPVVLGPKCVGWRESDIVRWLAERPSAN